MIKEYPLNQKKSQCNQYQREVMKSIAKTSITIYVTVQKWKEYGF